MRPVSETPIVNHNAPEDAKGHTGSIHLIEKLCSILAAENISYCHWKSNNAIIRSETGDNDLDLLVDRADVNKFTEILYRLQFKQAKTPKGKQMPGVVDYYGFDAESDKLIHVHAHYKLILGHDLTKNYRLPLEKQYLKSVVQGNLFKLPEVEYEYIVFIIRMVLKHFPWDVMLNGQGSLKAAENDEFTCFKAKINANRVYDILKKDLPFIPVALFEKCVKALEPDCSAWRRLRTAKQLQAALRSNMHLPHIADTFLKLWRRLNFALRRRIFRSSLKYRLTNGGAMIAIIGGDGAGKSTVVDGIYKWLSKTFNTTFTHLGKPDWSFVTISVRSILKIIQLLGFYPVESPVKETLQQKSLISPGYPWLLREVCRARDRYRNYLKARRIAARGGLVILDRYPISQILMMDGPQTGDFIKQIMNSPNTDLFLSPHLNNRIARKLVTIEEKYYHRIVRPEILIVLRLDPDIAVQRRSDEDESFVRERNTEIWQMNRDIIDANIIDASKPKKEVLNEIKALIWAAL